MLLVKRSVWFEFNMQLQYNFNIQSLNIYIWISFCSFSFLEIYVWGVDYQLIDNELKMLFKKVLQASQV